VALVHGLSSLVATLLDRVARFFFPYIRTSNCSKKKNLFNKLKTETMLRWTVIFLVVAIIAAVFGFGGIAAGAAGIAKILFFIFIVLFLLSLIFGRSATRTDL